MKILQICKAVFSHDTTHYFNALGTEEACFWEMQSQHNSIWMDAWQYYPRYKGLYWLFKLIFLRMVLPYLIFFCGVLSVIALVLYLVFVR